MGLVGIGVAYWETDPDEWDRLGLGTSSLPGVWKVTGSVSRDVEVKKSKGKDGARTTDHGYVPAKVTMVGRFVSLEAWALMQLLIAELHPPRMGLPRQPLQIRHPATQFLGIDTVYIESIALPELDDGILQLTIEAVEWRPLPKPKVETPAVPLQKIVGEPSGNPPNALSNFAGLV